MTSAGHWHSGPGTAGSANARLSVGDKEPRTGDVPTDEGVFSTSTTTTTPTVWRHTQGAKVTVIGSTPTALSRGVFRTGDVTALTVDHEPDREPTEGSDFHLTFSYRLFTSRPRCPSTGFGVKDPTPSVLRGDMKIPEIDSTDNGNVCTESLTLEFSLTPSRVDKSVGPKYPPI